MPGTFTGFPPQGDTTTFGTVTADTVATDEIVLDIANADVLINRQEAGHAGVGTASGLADGALALAALGTRAATTDTAPADLVVTGMDAWEQATNGQDEGADLILAGGIGVHSTTVADFSQSGYTVTVTVNGTAKVLTEGSASPDGWTNVTSNSVSATALAVEISLISGVTATAVAAVVHITADVGTYSLLLAETGTGNTVTNEACGDVAVVGTLTFADGIEPGQSQIVGPDDGSFRIRAASGQNMVLSGGTGTSLLVINPGDVHLLDDAELYVGSGKDRFLQGEATALVDDTASEFAAIQSALGDAGGGTITYTVKLTDATGVRAARSGVLTFQTLDGAAGVLQSITDVGQTLEESGTTTWAFAIDNTDDGDLEITCQTTTDLTPTAIVISWIANVSGDVTLSATP